MNEVARKRDFWKSGLESYFSYFHGAAGFCILLPIGLVETLGEAIPFRSAAAGFMSLAGLQIGDDPGEFVSGAGETAATVGCAD